MVYRVPRNGGAKGVVAYPKGTTAIRCPSPFLSLPLEQRPLQNNASRRLATSTENAEGEKSSHDTVKAS